VHLVGHSLGGGIAITLATLAPERVKSLVLVDSTGVPRVSLLQVIPRRALEMTAQLLLPKLGLKLGKIPQVFTHNLLFQHGQPAASLMAFLTGRAQTFITADSSALSAVVVRQGLDDATRGRAGNGDHDSRL
jgi:pimeloyl-ACP methyl ester carboxylesterase